MNSSEDGFHVALYQPEIPPNTGNIIRLCANTGAALHLIHPLGFVLDDKQLKRAGLDYHALTTLYHYHDWAAFLKAMAGRRIWACETGSNTHYHEAEFSRGDVLLFGSETRGLPTHLLREFADSQHLSIPMRAYNRSLNLANSVAIVLYEAWRQLDYK